MNNIYILKIIIKNEKSKISIVPSIRQSNSPIQNIICSQISASVYLTHRYYLISATPFQQDSLWPVEATERPWNFIFRPHIMSALCIDSCSDVLRSFRPEVSRRRPATHEERPSVLFDVLATVLVFQLRVREGISPQENV